MQPVTPIQFASPGGYQPGVCNIGPAEIARRRNFGHMALAVTIVLFVILVLLGVPSWVRLVVALPAAGAASGYLQAYFHFCAGFGSRGVFNFGDLGTTHEVTDPAALAADRTMSRRIGIWSAVIGAVVGVVAVLLPI
jgi:hypothetical protein